MQVCCVVQEKEDIIHAWQHDHENMRAIAEQAEAQLGAGVPRP